MTIVENQLSDLSDKVSSVVEVQLNNLSEKVDTLLTRVACSPISSGGVGETVVNAVAKELRERESRSKNAIFSGNVDVEKIELFVEKLEIPNAQIKKIGKSDKNIFLVEFQTQAEKWKAIGKARETCASSDNLKGMFVNPDLTRSEREVQFKLRQECRARKLQGEKVKIKKGVIVSTE